MLKQQKVGTAMCLFFWSTIIKTTVNGQLRPRQNGPKFDKYFYKIRR